MARVRRKTIVETIKENTESIVEEGKGPTLKKKYRRDSKETVRTERERNSEDRQGYGGD